MPQLILQQKNSEEYVIYSMKVKRKKNSKSNHISSNHKKHEDKNRGNYRSLVELTLFYCEKSYPADRLRSP
jgi:hypothetical protein